MYLKQKLKQEIKVALSTRLSKALIFPNLARDWCSNRKDKRRFCAKTKKERLVMLRTIKEVCSELAISRSTVYRLVESGKLRKVFVGGVPRITEASLNQLVGEQNG